jgi:hypothetical protein
VARRSGTKNVERKAEAQAASRLRAGAAGALDAAIAASLKVYDRRRELARLPALTPDIVAAETAASARLVVRELENALRRERARIGHWTYDLNRHIALLVALRAETARRETIARAAAGEGG